MLQLPGPSSVALLVVVVPFICHSSVAPSAFLISRSLLPSPPGSLIFAPRVTVPSANCSFSIPVNVSRPSSPSPTLVSVTVQPDPARVTV
jgi:hypothetical protein